MTSKINPFFFLFFLISQVNLAGAISMEVRRISDNALSGTIDFGSMSASTLYAQAQQYIVVRYEAGEEDSDSLKVFSDNLWEGAPGPRGGLVRTPTPTERVPVVWMAFDSAQSNVIFNSSNESSWRSLKDRNDPGFDSYNPADLELPVFPTGTTYIYFGAKSDAATPSAFYSANIKIKNRSVEGNAAVLTDGFGSFNKIFRTGTESSFQIPVNVAAPAGVSLKIIDRKNTVVRTWARSDYAAGNFQIIWDGRNDRGESLSSGLYMLILEIGSKKFKAKMAIVR